MTWGCWKCGQELNTFLDNIGQFTIAHPSDASLSFTWALNWPVREGEEPSSVAISRMLGRGPYCSGQVWVSAANQESAWADVSQWESGVMRRPWSGPGQCCPSYHLTHSLLSCTPVLRGSRRVMSSSLYCQELTSSGDTSLCGDSRVMMTYLDPDTQEHHHHHLRIISACVADCLFGITRMHVSASCVWFTKLANWPTVNIEGGQAKPRCFTIQISTQRFFSEYLDTAAVIVYVSWWALKDSFLLS